LIASPANSAQFSKIFVLCPGGLVTGGAELLHQLVDRLRRFGKAAYICYWPARKSFALPEAYRHYDAPQSGIEDEAGNLVVFPEIYTRHPKRIRHADCAIWWLSVDYYFRYPQNHRFANPFTQVRANRFYDPVRYLMGRLRNRPLDSIRTLRHFAQSRYAQDFLRQHGIQAAMLSDYLGADHLRETGAAEDKHAKQDIIVFNPKKGADVTARLMRALPGHRFVPIQDLDAHGVAQLLRSAKVYIDFGHHPGKDRPPREAAMAGCCVIVGGAGASAEGLDYLVPPSCRLDPNAPGFVDAFRALVERIYADYPAMAREFDAWRAAIRREPAEFDAQVAAIFAISDAGPA
jgi:hypothetical protein